VAPDIPQGYSLYVCPSLVHSALIVSYLLHFTLSALVLIAYIGNWLVCMAVFLAVSSREIISKIVSIWFPVMCFVGLGTDHVIANMYFIPLAIFLGAPAPLTVKYYIWKSMIPSLLGNIIGGGVFTGALYWYLYLAGTEVPIHFDTTPVRYAEETKTDHTIPDSGNGPVSGIAQDFHGSLFKKDNSASDGSV
jgi:hypothetical protein